MWPWKRTSDKPSLGARGEKLAAKHLRRHGLKLLAANYRCPGGEIDLIVLDPKAAPGGAEGTIVFVEVKTRNNDRYVKPYAAVDADKQNRLRKAARYYLAGRDTEGFATRFDVVSIVLNDHQRPQIEHLVGAF